MKVVLIAWGEAKKGTPQQFEWSVPIGPPVKVPARGSTMVKLPERPRGHQRRVGEDVLGYILKTP